MQTVNEIVWDAIHTGKNATPWHVGHLALLPAGTTTLNFTPSSKGLLNSQTYLPYIVPAAHVLVLFDVHFGRVPQSSLAVVLQGLITGVGFADVVIFSVSHYVSFVVSDLSDGLWIPAGVQLDVSVQNFHTTAITFYAGIGGILVDVSAAFKKPFKGG